MPTGGEYLLIYSFTTDITGVDSVTVSSGSANVGSRAIGPNPNQYTVQLTDVSDLQHLVVRLDSVQALAGASLASATARMDVVVGDTNASRSVNSSDISGTKSQAGSAMTAANFRSDVTANGAINGSDISAVKLKSGGGL
jgi:hypothetical protein